MRLVQEMGLDCRIISVKTLHVSWERIFNLYSNQLHVEGGKSIVASRSELEDCFCSVIHTMELLYKK